MPRPSPFGSYDLNQIIKSVAWISARQGRIVRVALRTWCVEGRHIRGIERGIFFHTCNQIRIGQKCAGKRDHVRLAFVQRGLRGRGIKSAGKVNRRLTKFLFDAAAPVAAGRLANGAGEITSVSPVAVDGLRPALGYVKRGATEFNYLAADGTLIPARLC